MTLLRILVCMAAVAGCPFLLAQWESADPGLDAERIKKGLSSSSPQVVAWSAYRAGLDPARQFGDELRKALAGTGRVGPEEPEKKLAVRAILDALIRSGVAVPMPELLPVVLRFSR